MPPYTPSPAAPSPLRPSSSIAVVTQRVFIFNDTVAANVAYGGEIDPRRVLDPPGFTPHRTLGLILPPGEPEPLVKAISLRQESRAREATRTGSTSSRGNWPSSAMVAARISGFFSRSA